MLVGSIVFKPGVASSKHGLLQEARICNVCRLKATMRFVEHTNCCQPHTSSFLGLLRQVLTSHATISCSLRLKT